MVFVGVSSYFIQKCQIHTGYTRFGAVRRKAAHTTNSSCVLSPKAAFSFDHWGVPRPVMASQPTAAGKPALQPACLLFPVVTSAPRNPGSPAAAALYSAGLIKPTVGLPWATRRSLTTLTMPANVGVAAEVPVSVPEGAVPPEITL